MMGSLFAAGFGPNVLEQYSWDQIALMGECIGLHYAGMLEGILGPVSESLGRTYKGRKITRGKQRKNTAIDYTDLASVKRAKDRDARILIGAGGVDGIQIDL